MLFFILAFVLIVVALLFVIPGLIRDRRARERDPEQANIEATRGQLAALDRDARDALVDEDQLGAIRRETESLLALELKQQASGNAARDRSPGFYTVSAIVLAVAVPALAILVYGFTGQPAALTGTQPLAVSDQHTESGQDLPSVEEMTARLEQRLAREPGDVEGWMILARTYMITRRFAEAEQAMERVYALSGDNPDVLSRYADAMVMADGGSFDAEANELLRRALALDPGHTQALWMSGMSAFKALEYEQAIGYFQRARAGLEDPESRAELDRLILTARERGGLADQPASSAAATGGADEASDGARARVRVSVALDEALADRVGADDSLFIFARAASGPPMPLAVTRRRAGQLPLEVELDDSMAMTPALKLSQFNQVVVAARISRSGEPTAQAGDVQGQSEIIDPAGADTVRVIINEIVE